MTAIKKIPQGLKIGFLGGGQLARMQILKAHELGLTPLLYCQSPEEPAAQVTPYSHLGSFKDQVKLSEFFKLCDVITFESEFLDSELLQTLSLKQRTSVLPYPEIMSSLQDRLLQKHALLEFEIPTADFVAVKSYEEVKSALKLLGPNLVLKQRRNGYDGNGTFFIQAKTPKAQIQKILNGSAFGFIAEKKITFRRELAVILVRDQYGKILDYPLVESHQSHARCDWVMGPVKHAEFKKLLKKIKIYLQQIDYVGAIGFELFDTGQKLLINEVAPRVHNSGHYTQNSFWPDQFLAHVMAVSGLHLPKLESLGKGFAMANIIGGSSNPIAVNARIEAPLHLYGKTQNRSGRKMGHLNTIAGNSKKALKKALKERAKVSR